ncbi:hypothetical protein DL96DRAFT_1806196 [Flagelloscypha sp. PMI_526]|nr:hypothetical protein DL96DRAFT_1806196 [Flagelloscypha sp. PMI_526]
MPSDPFNRLILLLNINPDFNVSVTGSFTQDSIRVSMIVLELRQSQVDVSSLPRLLSPGDLTSMDLSPKPWRLGTTMSLPEIESFIETLFSLMYHAHKQQHSFPSTINIRIWMLSYHWNSLRVYTHSLANFKASELPINLTNLMKNTTILVPQSFWPSIAEVGLHPVQQLTVEKPSSSFVVDSGNIDRWIEVLVLQVQRFIRLVTSEDELPSRGFEEGLQYLQLIRFLLYQDVVREVFMSEPDEVQELGWIKQSQRQEQECLGYSALVRFVDWMGALDSIFLELEKVPDTSELCGELVIRSPASSDKPKMSFLSA